MPVTHPTDATQTAYLQGRQAGLASAALALSIVGFVNLLGAEKPLLAAVLALLALRGGVAPSLAVVRRSRAALALAALYLATIILVTIVFREKLLLLIQLLQKLS